MKVQVFLIPFALFSKHSSCWFLLDVQPYLTKIGSFLSTNICINEYTEQERTWQSPSCHLFYREVYTAQTESILGLKEYGPSKILRVYVLSTYTSRVSWYFSEDIQSMLNVLHMGKNYWIFSSLWSSNGGGGGEALLF